jgi:hypothetical protein
MVVAGPYRLALGFATTWYMLSSVVFAPAAVPDANSP